MALRRVTNGTYDPVLGTATGGTSADAPCHGIFKQITDEYAKAFAVEANDQLTVIGGSVEPLMTDLLVVGASALAIVKIIAVNPAGTPLAYTLQVRGAIHESIVVKTFSLLNSDGSYLLLSGGGKLLGATL
jgi:hypothetical protein